MKLSVAITSYNRPKLLDRTLQNLTEQRRLPDETVVVDDCSPSAIEDIVLAYRDRLPKLSLIRHNQNQGMPATLNTAVYACSGEYIANLHDADELDPELLAKWEAALDKYPSAGFAFSGFGSYRTQGKESIEWEVPDIPEFVPGRTFYERYMRHRIGSPVWGTVMARRSAYERLLPFDPQFGVVSDVDMWMRMCLHYDVAYVREPLFVCDVSDNTQGQPRLSARFTWDGEATVRRIHETNLRRFYGDDRPRLRREMLLHSLAVQRLYIQYMLGPVYHGDWKRFRQGLAWSYQVGWPTCMLQRTLKRLWRVPKT